MDILPGVPLVPTEQFVALRANVQGYITSPFGPDLLTPITVRN